MLFDIKKNSDLSIICECHKCNNVAANELMLIGDVGIYICDKCLNNTMSKLSDDFQFNRVEE
jgi:hypothetical protein